MLQISPQIKLGVWVLLGVLLLLGSSKFIKGPIPVTEGNILGLNFTSSFSFAFQSSKLSKIIQTNLAGQIGKYAIYIEDLSDGESYGFNQFEQFPSASLYKLYLMAAVMEEIEKSSPSVQNDKSLTLDTVLTSTKTHLTEVYGEIDYGYEDAPETISYTVEEALTRIGRISDNFASLMLAEKIGWGELQVMADQLNAQNTTIKTPFQTSASDIGLFFKKLHQKSIVSVQSSEKITEFLSLNQLNSRIPAGLPEDIKVIHKTGELARVRHDAGIVYLSKGAYVVVLMSKDLPDEDEGVELLAQISKDVYEYFKEKSQ